MEPFQGPSTATKRLRRVVGSDLNIKCLLQCQFCPELNQSWCTTTTSQACIGVLVSVPLLTSTATLGTLSGLCCCSGRGVEQQGCHINRRTECAKLFTASHIYIILFTIVLSGHLSIRINQIKIDFFLKNFCRNKLTLIISRGQFHQTFLLVNCQQFLRLVWT